MNKCNKSQQITTIKKTKWKFQLKTICLNFIGPVYKKISDDGLTL